MDITEVRIKLMGGLQDRLLGFCSITIDHVFVVRDLKIIKGNKGAFVAMPSRKLMDRCPGCRCKNQLRAAYCSQCGISLGNNRSPKFPDGRAKLYADIAHPITTACRDLIQQRVLQAYDEELELSKLPGYVCRYEDFGDEADDECLGHWEEIDHGAPSFAQGHNGRHRRDGAQRHSPHPIAQLSAADGVPPRPEEFGSGVFS